MANLKLDLVGKLNNDKFYEEIELIRLAQDPAMNYKLKIEQMQEKLSALAVLNAQIGLVEQYFPEPQPEQQVAPPQADAPAAPVAEKAAAPVAEKPAGKVHQGQSHGEG